MEYKVTIKDLIENTVMEVTSEIKNLVFENLCKDTKRAAATRANLWAF